jgi:hypothetical protein
VGCGTAGTVTVIMRTKYVYAFLSLKRTNRQKIIRQKTKKINECKKDRM